MVKTNCPNCDGLLSYDGGLHCDYCGARFERPRREEMSVDVSFPDVDDEVARMVARGLLTANEARRLVVPEPYGTVGRK